MIVILDNIRSIHNVGSIFRTADAVGVEKIYLSGITPAPVDRFGLSNQALAKVALGAQNCVAWEQVGDSLDIMAVLQGKGYSVVALEQDERAVSLFDTRIDGDKLALVLGGEVDGLPPAIVSQADRVVEIPMRGQKESLNVSVAFGIAAYVLRYNRN